MVDEREYETAVRQGLYTIWVSAADIRSVAQCIGTAVGLGAAQLVAERAFERWSPDENWYTIIHHREEPMIHAGLEPVEKDVYWTRRDDGSWHTVRP